MITRTHANTKACLLDYMLSVKKKRKTRGTVVWQSNQPYRETEIPVRKTCRTFLSSEAANSNNSAVSDITPLNHTRADTQRQLHPLHYYCTTKALMVKIYCYSPHSPPFVIPYTLIVFHAFSPLFFFSSFLPDCLNNFLCSSISPPPHPTLLILCIYCQVN